MHSRSYGYRKRALLRDWHHSREKALQVESQEHGQHGILQNNGKELTKINGDFVEQDNKED